MKKYFITGLIILMPLMLTIFLFILLVDIFTSPFLDFFLKFLLKYQDTYTFLQHTKIITFLARIIILVLLVISIFFLGVLARWFLFKTFINWFNKILSKIPIIKTIYKTSRDIMVGLFSTKKDKKAFRYPVMIPFPSKHGYCIGFQSGEVPPICMKKIKKELTSVFIPTAPHPISGYMLFIPNSDVKKIKMTNEEAVKYTVSCGLITPEEIKKQDESLLKNE